MEYWKRSPCTWCPKLENHMTSFNCIAEDLTKALTDQFSVLCKERLQLRWFLGPTIFFEVCLTCASISTAQPVLPLQADASYETCIPLSLVPCQRRQACLWFALVECTHLPWLFQRWEKEMLFGNQLLAGHDMRFQAPLEMDADSSCFQHAPSSCLTWVGQSKERSCLPQHAWLEGGAVYSQSACAQTFPWLPRPHKIADAALPSC